MKNVDELYEKNFMITKMILTMMMGQMRVKRKKLTTNSLSCFIKQAKVNTRWKNKKNQE